MPFGERNWFNRSNSFCTPCCIDLHQEETAWGGGEEGGETRCHASSVIKTVPRGFSLRSKLFLPSLPPSEHCASLMCLLFRRKTEGVMMLETFADFFSFIVYAPAVLSTRAPPAVYSPPFVPHPPFWLIELQDFKKNVFVCLSLSLLLFPPSPSTHNCSCTCCTMFVVYCTQHML